MKTGLLILFFFSAALICNGQNNSALYKRIVIDSAKKNTAENLHRQPGSSPQISVSTDVISKGNLTGELYGSPIYTGKANTVRTTILLTIPVVSWGKNAFSLTGSYFQQHLNLSELQWADGHQGESQRTFNEFAAGLSASFQRRDSLFGKPVYYVASVSGLTNNAHAVKKLSYLGTAIFTFKQTATTRISAGLILNIDPSLTLPVFPIFSYWHKFDSGLEFNFGAPAGVGFKKEISKTVALTLGTAISGSVVFLNLDKPNLPHDVNYTTLDLKTGLGIEYKINKHVKIGTNGGILSPLQARAFQRNQSSSDYFLSNKLSATPYVNFNLSVSPF